VGKKYQSKYGRREVVAFLCVVEESITAIPAATGRRPSDVRAASRENQNEVINIWRNLMRKLPWEEVHCVGKITAAEADYMSVRGRMAHRK